jgi:hypothetical protein
MSQSSEFCHHNPLCCFSMSVYCCLFRYDSVWKLLDTPSYFMLLPQEECTRESNKLKAVLVYVESDVNKEDKGGRCK